MAISQNTALFSLLGTYYGGNGTTNFQLPDLRGRVAIHQGTGPGLSQYVIGEVGGTETHTLTQNEIPAHTHNMGAVAGSATQRSPNGNLLAEDPTLKSAFYASGAPNATLAPQTISLTGGSQPHSIIQPFLSVQFSIALQGVYPSRN